MGFSGRKKNIEQTAASSCVKLTTYVGPWAFQNVMKLSSGFQLHQKCVEMATLFTVVPCVVSGHEAQTEQAGSSFLRIDLNTEIELSVLPIQDNS